MVSYLKSHSPRFDKKASELLGKSELKASLKSNSLAASGKCPRCSHEFQYVGGAEVTTVDAPAVAGEAAGPPPPSQRLVVVRCQCADDHAGRPDDLLGCGLSFVVDVHKKAIPDPIKAALALDDQAQFDQLTTDPGAAIQSSAKAWSAGLSALLTLVVTGIWVGGQSAASKVDPASLAVIVPLAGIALGLHIIALILLLVVSSGIPQTLSTTKLRRSDGSVRNYRESIRKRHATMIRSAAVLGIVGLVPMLIALGMWILAPAPDPKVSVDITDKPAACGEITTVSDSSLTLASGGKEKSIPLSDIDGISAVSECG